MATAFRWILLFAVTLVATALLQPFIDQFLLSVGWVAAPGKAISMALNWIEQIVGVEAFPWVAGVTIGLAAGSWLDSILRRFDGRHPIGKIAKGRTLSSSAAFMASRLDVYLNNPFAHRSAAPDLWVESLLLVDKIGKLGVVAPPVMDEPTNDNLMKLCLYFKLIGPMLREGEIESARLIAAGLNSDPTAPA